MFFSLCDTGVEMAAGCAILVLGNQKQLYGLCLIGHTDREEINAWLYKG